MTTLQKRYGPYLLLQRLARGGMGEIFLGQKSRREGGSYVAIKTLRHDLTRDKEYVTRFLDEARVAIILNNPGINKVLDVGYAEGTYFLELEYISGRDVRTILERARDLERPIPPEISYYIVGELLNALAYLHAANDISGAPLNLIHRDVSPQNIMAAWDGRISLIDFGLARFAARKTETEPGMVMGKLRYMAPEQAQGASFDLRVDIFASGVILYELLSGRRLYENVEPGSLWEVVARGRALEGVCYELFPPEAAALIRRALAVNPAHRYQSAKAFIEDVRRISNLGPVDVKIALADFLADLFEVDLRVEREFMEDLGRIAPFDLSPEEGTLSVSLADPSVAIPLPNESSSNPFSLPASTTDSDSFEDAPVTETTPVSPEVLAAGPPMRAVEDSSSDGELVTEPSLPRSALAELIRTAEASEETDRVAGASRLGDAPRLSALAEEQTLLLHRDGGGHPSPLDPGELQPLRQRRRRQIVFVAALLLAAGAGAFYMLWGRHIDWRDPGAVGGIIVDPASAVPPPSSPEEVEVLFPSDLDSSIDPDVESGLVEETPFEPDGGGGAGGDGGGAGTVDAAGRLEREEVGADDRRVVAAEQPSKRRRPRARDRRRRSGRTASRAAPSSASQSRSTSGSSGLPPVADISTSASRSTGDEASQKKAIGRARELLRSKGLSLEDGFTLWPETRQLRKVDLDERARQALLRKIKKGTAEFTFTREFVKKKLNRIESRYQKVRPRLDNSSSIAKDIDGRHRATLDEYLKAGNRPDRLRVVNRLLNDLELRLRYNSG